MTDILDLEDWNVIAKHGGGMTNAVQLLVRPLDVRSDESGGHPGELFVMLTLTREELREMLAALEQIASGEADNGSLLSGGECQRIAYDAIASVKGGA